MRTLSKLLSAPVIAGMLGAVAMTAAVPAMARDYGRGHHWYGHHEYNHWRGHRGGWGWRPNVSFGFYNYPYYSSDYYGYYGSPYYNCNPNSWYYDPDDCYGGYYGYYDWDD